MSTIDIYNEFSAMVADHCIDNGFPLSAPNVKFDAGNAEAWIELIAFWNGSENYGIADNSVSIEYGFFRVIAHAGAGEGLARVQQMAESVATLFKKGTQFGGARVENPPSITGPIQTDVNISIPVTVRWRATRNS